ncbi:MAG: (Fe-S)-binding protein, partial [Myxococcales bacterium]|nr:(Fe-S)-binding protein [Myxococcales bacterium]
MLDQYRKEIEYCTFCPKMCRFVCPVAIADANESSHPTGKMTILHLLRDEALDLDGELAEVFYKCTGCMLCETFCEHDQVLPPVFEAGKALAVDRGVNPEAAERLAAKCVEKGSPFGADLRAEQRRLVPNRYFSDEAQVVYFAGCTQIHQDPKALNGFVKILGKAKVDTVAAWDHEDMCCGYPLMATGHMKEFEALARRNIERMNGLKKLIVADPGCLHTFKTRYRDLGLSTRVELVHASEWLAELIDTGALTPKRTERERVVYHDPCYLGRHQEIYDAPRAVLGGFLEGEVGEFRWNRENSKCCGGGEAYPVLFPEEAERIADARVEDARERAAERIVTTCPTCVKRLGRRSDGVPV